MIMNDVNDTITKLNQLPLVSVIIPAYNSAATIRECIIAVLNSDYKNFEVIAVDDGSIDNTYEIMSSFHLISCIKKENGGSASAKNFGVRLAHGDYYYFLDSDVVVFKDTITRLVDTAVQYSADMVVGRYSTEPMNNGIVHHYKAITDYVLYIPKKYKNTVMMDGQIGGGGELYSAVVFNKLGGFNEHFRGASVEREELLLRFYKAGFHSAASPMIRTRHYFPDFKNLIKTYIFRIYDTIKLINGKKHPFTYISYRKAIIAPTSVFLFLTTAPCSLLGFLHFIIPILCMVIFVTLNYDLIIESYKRKGLIMTVEILAIHLIVSLVIFLTGTIGTGIVLLGKLVKKA